MIVGVILEVAEAVIAIAQIGGDSNGYANFFARDAAVQGKGGNVWAAMFPNSASVTTRMVSMGLSFFISICVICWEKGKAQQQFSCFHFFRKKCD